MVTLDSRFERLLVVAPHCDDAELGVGGLLAAAAASGRESQGPQETARTVRVVVLAAGDIRFNHGGVVTAETRVQEAREGLGSLGVEASQVSIYSRLESRLPEIPHADTVRHLDELLESFRPTAFFFPLPSAHQDHRYAFECCLSALRPGSPGSRLRLAAAYEYPSNLVDPQVPFNSRIYLDISDFLEAKIRAFECHRSQASRPGYHLISSGGVRDLARLRGREVGVEFAERYYLVREVI